MPLNLTLNLQLPTKVALKMPTIMPTLRMPTQSLHLFFSSPTRFFFPPGVFSQLPTYHKSHQQLPTMHQVVSFFSPGVFPHLCSPIFPSSVLSPLALDAVEIVDFAISHHILVISEVPAPAKACSVSLRPSSPWHIAQVSKS